MNWHHLIEIMYRLSLILIGTLCMIIGLIFLKFAPVENQIFKNMIGVITFITFTVSCVYLVLELLAKFQVIK